MEENYEPSAFPCMKIIALEASVHHVHAHQVYSCAPSCISHALLLAALELHSTFTDTFSYQYIIYKGSVFGNYVKS